MMAGLPEIQAKYFRRVKKLNSKIVDKIMYDGELDQEWVELILEALEVGISIDEIKDFFENKNHNIQLT